MPFCMMEEIVNVMMAKVFPRADIDFVFLYQAIPKRKTEAPAYASSKLGSEPYVCPMER